MRSQSQSQSRKSESPFNFSIHPILWGHLRNCLQDVSIPRHITNGPLTKPENVGLQKHRDVNNYQTQLSGLSLCWYDPISPWIPDAPGTFCIPPASGVQYTMYTWCRKWCQEFDTWCRRGERHSSQVCWCADVAELSPEDQQWQGSSWLSNLIVG